MSTDTQNQFKGNSTREDVIGINSRYVHDVL